MHEEHHQEVVVHPPDKAKIRKIWMTALILAIVTALEFVVAFTVPLEMQMTRVVIFVGMTIVKAAYIVGEFMHLRYETKVLMWSFLIPFIFLIWMLVAFFYEGMAIFDVRYF